MNRKYSITVFYVNDKKVTYEASQYVFDAQGLQLSTLDTIKYYIPYNNVMSIRILEG